MESIFVNTGNYYLQQLMSSSINVRRSLVDISLSVGFLDPGGSKSRRLISQMNGNYSSSTASLRTVVSFFYIVYQIVWIL